MTIEKMRKLVQKHADLETQLDLEGVLSTLVDILTCFNNFNYIYCVYDT